MEKKRVQICTHLVTPKAPPPHDNLCITAEKTGQSLGQMLVSQGIKHIEVEVNVCLKKAIIAKTICKMLRHNWRNAIIAKIQYIVS